MRTLIIFLQVYRQIFTGPRTATQPGAGRKGRASKSRMHNLTQISPRTIAYTCVMVSLTIKLLHLTSHIYFYFQTRIALWGKGWTIDDGAFEYPVFYQNIVRMFEMDPDDEWVQETLAWWHEYTLTFYTYVLLFTFFFLGRSQTSLFPPQAHRRNRK